MTTKSTIRTVEETDDIIHETRVTEITGSVVQRFYLDDPKDQRILREILDEGELYKYLEDEVEHFAHTPITKVSYTITTGEGWIEFEAEAEEFDSVWEEDDYE